MRKSLWAAAAATALISTAAMATVTFDRNTGIGFVGKGDVQLAFGWNNATMQNKHLGITFAVDQSVSYDVTCEWTTETGGRNSKTITHDVTRHRSLSSSAAIDSTSRKTGQYTGWFLGGYTDGGLDDVGLPHVGDPCPMGGGIADSDPPANDATVSDVSNIIDTGTSLYAYDGSNSRLLATY